MQRFECTFGFFLVSHLRGWLVGVTVYFHVADCVIVAASLGSLARQPFQCAVNYVVMQTHFFISLLSILLFLSPFILSSYLSRWCRISTVYVPISFLFAWSSQQQWSMYNKIHGSFVLRYFLKNRMRLQITLNNRQFFHLDRYFIDRIFFSLIECRAILLFHSILWRYFYYVTHTCSCSTYSPLSVQPMLHFHQNEVSVFLCVWFR